MYEKGGKSPSELSELVLRSDADKVKIEELPLYSFEMLATATANFYTTNLLGMGGFGPVYKVTIIHYSLFISEYVLIKILLLVGENGEWRRDRGQEAFGSIWTRL